MESTVVLFPNGKGKLAGTPLEHMYRACVCGERGEEGREGSHIILSSKFCLDSIPF